MAELKVLLGPMRLPFLLLTPCCVLLGIGTAVQKSLSWFRRNCTQEITNKFLHYRSVTFLLGILFVGFYLFAGKRVKERHRVASILKKLGAA